MKLIKVFALAFFLFFTVPALAQDAAEAPEGDAKCGGIAGVECRAGYWCDFPDDAACGIGDVEGTCRVIPEICTHHEDPVCGCDGKDYGNPCKANAAGTDVQSKGKCEGDK